jgi:hypothetical protein
MNDDKIARFRKFIEEASRVIDSWPRQKREWILQHLSGSPTLDGARRFIDQHPGRHEENDPPTGETDVSKPGPKRFVKIGNSEEGYEHSRCLSCKGDFYQDANDSTPHWFRFCPWCGVQFDGKQACSLDGPGRHPWVMGDRHRFSPYEIVVQIWDAKTRTPSMDPKDDRTWRNIGIQSFEAAATTDFGWDNHMICHTYKAAKWAGQAVRVVLKKDGSQKIILSHGAQDV